MKTFINKQSAPCLLGPMSKNAEYNSSLFTWTVNSKKHFSVFTGKELIQEDIDFLKKYGASNFHYLAEVNLEILKKHFSIEKTKMKSTETTIKELNFSGKKNAAFRNYLNRYKNFEILHEFKNIEDVKTMIDTWSNTSAQKYFRDFSGKNYHFFKNGFHTNCENVFVYDKDKLVAFGIASVPSEGYCSYVIGKALCLEYPGLSEFTDIKLYELLFNKHGEFTINLGQAHGGMVFYKTKFPNTEIKVHYDGKIKI